jgi:hypothetical protein
MIILTDNQINSIKQLNPLIDSKFEYDKLRWAKLDSEYSYLINEFEGRFISRKDIIDAYAEYYSHKSKGFMKAFLLTMIWGFANTGYGTYRTNKYISHKDNIKKIKNAIDYIDQNGNDSLKNAFEELIEIKGLGVSYLTKIIYFATRAKNLENYALIFDIRVASTLIKLTTPNEIFEVVSIRPSYKFNNYQIFNQIIHQTARNYKVEAEQIEMYLFNQIIE